MANSDISGQITDGSDNPIASAEVYLWREDLAGAGGVVASTTADSNGNFSFTAHPDASGTSESWHVAAKDPNTDVQLQSAYGVTANPPTSVDSQFDISITGTNSPVNQGETLTVDASLTNSGTDSDTQTITLGVDNGVGQVDSSLEAAQGGASESTTLSWAVPSEQTRQDYVATVSSDDDTAAKTVTVSGTLLSDNFNDNSFDTSKWTKATQSHIIEETNQELHVATSSAANENVVRSTDSYGPGVVIEGHVQTDVNSDVGGHDTRFGFSDGSNLVAFDYPQNFQKNAWYAITNDGSITETTIDNGGLGSFRTYKIEWQSSTVTFYINDTQVAQHTTNIPTTSLPVQLSNSKGGAASSQSDSYFDNVIVK